MSPKDLEELVVSTMQETQVKLGSASGSEVLYLPLASIDPEEDLETIGRVLDGFRTGCRSRLGDVECEILDQMVRITVPESGNPYVSKLPVSPTQADGPRGIRAYERGGPQGRTGPRFPRTRLEGCRRRRVRAYRLLRGRLRPERLLHRTRVLPAGLPQVQPQGLSRIRFRESAKGKSSCL